MKESGDVYSFRNLRRITISVLLTVILIPALMLAADSAKLSKSDRDAQIEGLRKKLQEQLEKSDWNAALAVAEQAQGIDPTGAGSVMRGMVLNTRGDFDAAIQEFDRVTAQTGRDPALVANRADAFANRSFSFYQKGEFLKAIDSAYFALLEKGDHAAAHNYRGIAYIARQQYDKAIASFDRAIKADPKFAEAYSNRGAAHGFKNNPDQMLADQKKALELNSNLVIAMERLARAKLAKGDPAGASADIDKALKLKPSFPEALCVRAQLSALKGDAPRALSDLDQALKINPKLAWAHVQRGLVFAAQKQPDKAIAAFDEAISLDGNHLAEAYCYRGYAYDKIKKSTQAAEDFTKAIELDPKMTAAYSGRSEAYKRIGKTNEAVADASKVKELQPPPPSKSTKKKEDAEKKKLEEKKKIEPPENRFLVASQGVDSKKRSEALKSAAEIDRLVSLNYQKYKITPNDRTTDEQFVRRIYLDITGTIPSFPQTQKFLFSRDPDRRAALIDELLSSDGYAGHFFNYWADVLRYTDRLTERVRGEPYRQWIKQSLAENKPWDKFVEELIVAEGLVWNNPATGYMQRDSGMPLDNMNNTVRIFLGTRIGCAQCHNHPFDRWTQKEFYEMAAFSFGTATKTGGGDTRFWGKNPSERLAEEYSLLDQEEEDRRNNYYRFEALIDINMQIVNDQPDRQITLPGNYAYSDAKPGEVIAPKTLFGPAVSLKSGEPPRKAFARWLVAKDNPRFALTIANRLWKQAFGVGQIEPVDDMMDDTVAENPELMQFLESEMKRLNFDMKEYLRIIFNSETYQRQACFEEVNPGTPFHFPGPMLRRMTAEQLWDSFLTLAVVRPDEFRELKANARTEFISIDLSSISANDVLLADNKANTVDYSQGGRQAKYMYKDVLLARASELPSPAPPSHFLRVFGQSDRELISASSTQGSVPQVLFMFNGPITHMLLEKNSTIHNIVMKKQQIPEAIRAIFLTILSREPDPEELVLATKEVKENGMPGFGNVVWSLVNTREFLFVQ